MKTNSTVKKAALAIAGAAAVATGFTPVAAFAQSAYDSSGYYYDPCRRDQSQRAVVGGVLGAIAGMALGNNSSDRRYRRHDNAAIGTVIGGIAGAGIGASTAGCTPEPRYRQTYSYNYTPDYGYDRYYDRRGYDRYGYGYGYDDYAYAPPAYGAPPSYDYGRPPLACTYAESPVRMPDGRTQRRMVQVCPDSQGRYQIVE